MWAIPHGRPPRRPPRKPVAHLTLPTAGSAARLGSGIGRGVRLHPLGAAALLVFSVFVVFLLSSFPQFATSDDLTMKWIANGLITADGPSGELVFTSVLIGAPIAALYRLVPELPWYAIYLYLVELIAAVTIAYVVFARERLRLSIDGLLVFGLLITVFWSAWLQLQFTNAAFLIGFAGIALHLGRSHLPDTPPASAIIAGAMLGIAFLIRQNSALGAGLFAAPLLVSSLWRISLRRQVMFASAALVIAGAAFLAIAASNVRSSEWSEYRAFNRVRGELHGTPQLSQVGRRTDGDALIDSDWTILQYDLFSRWQYYDEEQFSVERLNALKQALPKQTFDLGKQVEDFQKDHRWRYAMLLTIVLAAASTAPRRAQLELAALTVWTVGIMAWLAVNVRLPLRVSLPMIAFIPIIALTRSFARRERPPTRPLLRRGIAAAVALVVVATTAYGIDRSLTQSAEQRIDSERADKLFDRLIASDPNGLYLVWANTLGLDRQSVWYEDYPDTSGFIPTGWYTRSPHQRGVFAANGVDDPFIGMIERDDFYMVYVPNLGAETMIKKLYKQDYGVTVWFEPVKGWDRSNRIRMVRIRQVKT